jgi:DUF1680 family protein
MNLPMPPRRIVAHPRAMMNAGSVALMRGPVLYCLESCDHPGVDLFDIRLPDDAEIADGFEGDLLDGVVVLRASGRAGAFPAGRLYADIEDLPRTSRSVALTAVPYFAWANRQPGAMRVWIPRG